MEMGRRVLRIISLYQVHQYKLVEVLNFTSFDVLMYLAVCTTLQICRHTLDLSIYSCNFVTPKDVDLPAY